MLRYVVSLWTDWCPDMLCLIGLTGAQICCVSLDWLVPRYVVSHWTDWCPDMLCLFGLTGAQICCVSLD